MNEDSTLTDLTIVLRRCKKMVKYILSFGFMLNCLTLGTPIYSMQVLDRVLSSSSLNTLSMLTIVILFIVFIISALNTARNFAMNRIGMWFENTLAPKILISNIQYSLKFKNKASNQPLRDINVIRSFLTSNSLMIIMDAPWAIVFLTALFILHPLMGILATISGSLLIITGLISDKITRQMIKESNEEFVKSMKYVDQSNRNADVIEVMNMHSNIVHSWSKINDKAQNMQKQTNDRQIMFAELMRFIRSSLQIAVTGFGAYLTLRGEFSPGAMIASSTLIGRALAPLEAAVNSWKNITACKQAYSRLSELLQITSHNKKTLVVSTKPSGNIKLSNISWITATRKEPILKNINLEIQAGEIVFITGNSGSGKTSLASIIVGALNPTDGLVEIDGFPISKAKHLGDYIGYLPQEVNLFYGTIKENIAKMNSTPNIDDVVKAAKIAGAHELIMQISNGYDTHIGVNGSSISGGQRQRVGLARALYGSPSIIVLDEPNASLDDDGDHALHQAISNAKKNGQTVIIISHRKSILALADKIGFMESGKLLAYGDKAVVMPTLPITA